MSYSGQLREDQSKAYIRSLQERITRLTREVPYEERRELERAQSRFDSVAAHTGGEQAPPPLMGETPLEYRKRLVAKYQPQCERFKNTSLYSLDSPTLELVEAGVYHDAVEAAKRSVPAGELREIRQRDAAGRTITTYMGDNLSWMRHFMSGAQVGHFVRNPPDKLK